MKTLLLVRHAKAKDAATGEADFVRVLNEPASSLARLLKAKAGKDGTNVKVSEEPKAKPAAAQPEAQAVAEPVAAASEPSSESTSAEPKTESTGEAPAAEVAGPKN